MEVKTELMCTECDCIVDEGTYYGDPDHGPVVHKNPHYCIRALKAQRDRLQQELQNISDSYDPLEYE